MEIKTGKVKYFNPKDFHGKIIVEGLGQDVYVNILQIDTSIRKLIF